MQNFPRTLAFQSSVDATVSTTALISRLFDRLPDQGHELILFDINRLALVEHLLSKDPADQLEGLLAETDHTFSLTVVSNSMEEGVPSRRVNLRRREAGTMETIEKSTEMSWPDETFSLSHIAIPFPENDSLYGSGEGGKVPTLGNRALRGERGTLLISPGEMLRQKWNPFYSWLEQKSLTFTGLDSVE